MKRYVLTTLICMASLSSIAKIGLPPLISDNMVLQQQSRAHLWGSAKPGSAVTVKTSWSETAASTVADASGHWSLRVATPEATSQSQSITVSDTDDSKVLGNVLIGEVWYCSGQSNMECPIRGYKHQPVEGSLDVILSSKGDRPIRMFTVEKAVSETPVDSCRGHWALPTPDEVADFSATAYFFADELNRVADNVPVGIILSAWGGTRLQRWTTDIFNGMVAPVLPYSIRGMLWYQGESNVDDPGELERLMPGFVDKMRKGFGRGDDMPFYYVQVAPCKTYGIDGDSLLIPQLRIAQSHLQEQRANCAMAVTLDIGDEHCIHPGNKRDVGKRLAYLALNRDYGRNSHPSTGPIFNHMEVQADKHRALLYFDNCSGGVSPLEVELDGFEAAGADGVYHKARAIVECETGTLSVYCTEVPEIKKVRYGHRPWFRATLFDNYGLPASPFVTSGELN